MKDANTTAPRRRSRHDRGGTKNQNGTLAFRGYPMTVQANDFDTLMEVKPEKGAKTVKCDLVLDRAKRSRCKSAGRTASPWRGLGA